MNNCYKRNFGCIVMFAAIILAQLPERIKSQTNLWLLYTLLLPHLKPLKGPMITRASCYYSKYNEDIFHVKTTVEGTMRYFANQLGETGILGHGWPTP
jgi:hypothetical protein